MSAWNGEEEILVLSVDQKSLIGKGAAMNVLPMSGKHIDVREGKVELFTEAVELITSKPIGRPIRISKVQSTKIGPHNISVVRSEGHDADSKEDEFADAIQKYVKEEFGSEGVAALTDRAKKVIEGYLKAGFEYFALDLVKAAPTLSTKNAIVYHFESE